MEKGFDRLFSKSKSLLALERQSFAHPMVRTFATLSLYVSRQLIEHYGVEKKRITIIPNGACLPTLDNTQKNDSRRQLRHGFGIAEDATVFLFVAYNPDLKGLTPLLHALKLTIDNDADIVLLCAGNFPYHHQQLAATLGVRDRVKVVGTTEQMADLFAASDALAHPSFFDAGSKIVVESLMTATPVITSRFDGSSELVIGNSHEPRGMVLGDPANIESLASALTAMTDPTHRKRFTSAMTGLAESLNMSKHVDALEQVLIDAAE